jgi:hypothetical protein
MHIFLDLPVSKVPALDASSAIVEKLTLTVKIPSEFDPS